MKILKKILFPALMIATLFAACKKDDKNDGPSSTSHKVVFKAIGSSDADLSIAVYGYDTQVTTLSNLSGATWTSPEVTVPAGALTLNVGVSGTATNSNATLKVQILVDGQVKAEGTSAGTVLSGHASYNF